LKGACCVREAYGLSGFLTLERSAFAVAKDPNAPTTSTLNAAGLDGSLTDVQVSVNVFGAPICSRGLVVQHPDGTTTPLLVVGNLPTTFQCGANLTSLHTTFPRGTPAAGAWKLIVTDMREKPGSAHFTINAWMLVLTAQK
jgi:hypothetical protein